MLQNPGYAPGAWANWPENGFTFFYHYSLPLFLASGLNQRESKLTLRLAQSVPSRDFASCDGALRDEQ